MHNTESYITSDEMSEAKREIIWANNPNRRRLTKNVNVLSWDCGTTNLCYCFLEDANEPGREFRIVKWQNFSLFADSIKEATETFVNEANRRPWMLDADYVSIESQVLKNSDMKAISHVIQCYFRTRATLPVEFNDGVMYQPPVYGPSVNFVDSKSKFTLCVVPEPKCKSRRDRNKQIAVTMARKLLSDQGETVALEFLNSFKKKDDLSDSFLLGLYFLRKLRNQHTNSSTIRKHLGLNAVEDEGSIVIDLNLNEGCEIDDEIPLPKTYKKETYSHPIYNLEGVNASACYKRAIEPLKWTQ